MTVRKPTKADVDAAIDVLMYIKPLAAYVESHKQMLEYLQWYKNNMI